MSNLWFGPNTKILCLDDYYQDEYILIENIRNFTLVKTTNHGYIPIIKIQNKTILNPGHADRVVDRLYQYPEHNLMMTGYSQKNGVMVAFDESAEPYLQEGKYDIWHITLDKPSASKIYVNGLLMDIGF